MRVLTLSTLFPYAAQPNFGVFVERQTLALAARDDIEVQVVAPRGMLPGPFGRLGRRRVADLPDREERHGLTVHRPRFTVLPGTGGRWHGATLERALAPVLDSIRADFAFDVIHASFFYPDGPAAIAMGRRYGVPVSIKARGADIHHWGHASGTAAAVRAAGRAADGVLAVGAALARDMAAIGIAGATVHETGIDNDLFRPADRAKAKRALGIDGPLVVSVGHLIPRKGHDIAIEAIAALPGVTLAIAGEGPERARLSALIERLGVGNRVRLLGAKPHRELAGLFAAADVMALASSSEGLANVWVEALASGTPIVVPDAGGAREVVTSPAAGRIVPRDPLAFAAGIADLLADPPARERVAEAASRFSWERNAAMLEDHLRGLISSG